MVNKVSFFTPVYFTSETKSWKEKIGEALDGFFDVNFKVNIGPIHLSLGSKRAYVVPKFNVGNNSVVKIIEAPAPKQGLLKTACKIVLFVPALILKGLYRLMIPFYTSSAVDFMLQRQKTTEEILNECLKNSGTVNSGYGEYVVFHDSQSGRKGVNQETYQKANQVFKEFKTQLFEKGMKGQTSEQLYQNLRQRIKMIDNTLDIQFIPKTLFELVFLGQSIEKEIKAQKNFHDWSLVPAFDPKHNKIDQNREFVEASDKTRYLQIAFEFNNAVVGILSTKPKNLTFCNFSSMALEQMKYLNTLTEKESPAFKAAVKVKNSYGDVHDPLSRYFMQNRCFDTNEQKQMIYNTMALECSSVGKQGVLLYRGGNMLADSPDDSNAKSGQSYGMSLFAGIFYDKGATAFEYCNRDSRDAYIYGIPFNELHSDAYKVWKVPNDPHLYQMAGSGEEFHARSRADNSARYFIGTGRHETDARSHFKLPANSRAYPINNSV